ncbi:hypothetical protein [Streptococcus loxodontisalivarius]|uniref:DUF2798 domain-containing protein n=1 Tax=Streptococcus loxodontisalivarius TaxID=1349415 RepID=A0ABS2PRH4_9STRE|nr:hypothetical protein [Streptococcus loxodontisalivarius]MBM7642590.1 hypothetical protein [Streptococcus loxodontisalivarius]
MKKKIMVVSFILSILVINLLFVSGFIKPDDSLFWEIAGLSGRLIGLVYSITIPLLVALAILKALFKEILEK